MDLEKVSKTFWGNDCNKCDLGKVSNDWGIYYAIMKTPNKMIHIYGTHLPGSTAGRGLIMYPMGRTITEFAGTEGFGGQRVREEGVVYNSLRAQEVEYEKRDGKSNQIEARHCQALAAGYINDGDAVCLNNGFALLPGAAPPGLRNAQSS